MHNLNYSLGNRIKSLLFQAEVPTANDNWDEKENKKQTKPAQAEDTCAFHPTNMLVRPHGPKTAVFNQEESHSTDNPTELWRLPEQTALDLNGYRGMYSYLPKSWINRNRALSIRSKSSNRNDGGAGRKPFSFQSLRGNMQPELSRKLYKVIKSSNNLITAHDTAAKERTRIATELSEWGEQTNDEAVSDISDKVGVILSELGEQEENYAHNLEDSRGVLKAIRNTEKSVQPSRDNKAKIADEIQKLKVKEPQSTKLVVLEQELVRAEAENLVAEAQLSNVTRQKLKEAYEAEFAAVIERAERQIILAKHGRRLLRLLDDSPMTPGDAQRAYEHGGEARQILNDAEDDLRKWEPDFSEESYHDAQGSAGYAEGMLESPIATGQQYRQPEQGGQGVPLNDATLRENGREPALAGSSSTGIAT